mgnify:FL=1|jgi:hypothetical protein
MRTVTLNAENLKRGDCLDIAGVPRRVRGVHKGPNEILTVFPGRQGDLETMSFVQGEKVIAKRPKKNMA